MLAIYGCSSRLRFSGSVASCRGFQRGHTLEGALGVRGIVLAKTGVGHGCMRAIWVAATFRQVFPDTRSILKCIIKVVLQLCKRTHSVQHGTSTRTVVELGFIDILVSVHPFLCRCHVGAAIIQSGVLVHPHLCCPRCTRHRISTITPRFPTPR